MVIYKPRGRAGEFAHLALNHYQGCSHRCVYCYAPACTRNPQFFIKQQVKPDILPNLKKEAPKYAGTADRVLLSFSSDPYQPLDDELYLTRKVIEVLNGFKIPFQVLTKSGLRAARDFDLYTVRDAFAVTLTAVCDRIRRKYEPGAASPADRIASLQHAKDKFGIETWVSLEPVIDAEQSLLAIEKTRGFVDHYKIGTMNRFKVDVDWRDFGQRAIELCEKYGRDYYIKEDLAKHLQGIKFKNTDRRCAPPTVTYLTKEKEFFDETGKWSNTTKPVSDQG